MKVICVVGLVPFPHGGGATSRLRSFALGLAEAGAAVEVHAYESEAGSELAPGTRVGSWRDVATRTYSHSRGVRPARIRWRRLRWQEDAAILQDVEQGCAAGRIGTVFFYNQEPGFALRLLRICRKWKVPFVQQYAELHIRADIGHGVPLPHFLREHGHMRLLPRLADGAVAISRLLEERCRRSSGAPVLRVPALTNTQEKPVLPLRPDTPFAVTYLGAGARRDCLAVLVAGFRLFQLRVPQARLQLFGLGSATARMVRQEIQRAGLQDRALVERWRPVEELDAALAETDAYVLLRTDDDSSRACFPTRLPEFLLQERPVLMNPVGDVAAALAADSEYAAVRSLEPDAIAAALEALARQPGRRREIGRAGAQAAEREFGYRRWGRELAQFFQRIRSR